MKSCVNLVLVKVINICYCSQVSRLAECTYNLALQAVIAQEGPSVDLGQALSHMWELPDGRLV